MVKKITTRLLALLFLLVGAWPAWSQNSATGGCQYTLVLCDWNYMGFQGAQVIICDETGTPFDTVAMPESYNNYQYSQQILAQEGQTLKFRFDTTGQIEQWYLQNLQVQLIDPEGNQLFYNNVWNDIIPVGEENFFYTMVFHCPTCYKVMWVNVESYDSASVTINWQDTSSNATGYVVSYSTSEYDIPQYFATVTDTFATITGLTPNTDYYFNVRTYCGEGDTAKSMGASVTTAKPKLSRLYVNCNVGSEAVQDGTSWATAYSNISNAINDFAQQVSMYNNYPEIWVAGGTYYYYYYYNCHAGMKVYGGFAGTESTLAERPNPLTTTNPTVLNGGGNSYVIYSSSYYTEDQQCMWDGFVIQGADQGVYIYSGTMLRNCIVRNNNRRGVYAYGNNSNNRPIALQNCIVENNSSSYGISGKGVYARYVTLDNCIIRNNEYTGTSSSYYGGGVYSYGGVTMRHCDIVGNTSRYGGGYRAGSGDTLINSIIWGNISSYSSGTSQIYSPSSIWAVNSALPQSGINGTGNIVLDAANYGSDANANYPNFVDVAGGDFRLNVGSACIDAGTQTDLPAANTDIFGNPRPHGTAPDMGAIESDGTLFCTAPSGLSLASSTTATATISWQPANVDGYTLQWAAYDADTWITVDNITGYSHTINGLEEFGYYKVRLRATCNSSQTDWSDILYFRAACTNPIDGVVIGGTTGYSTSDYPVNTKYDYSRSCFIVESGELGTVPRDFDAIGFYVASSNTVSRNITIAVIATTDSEVPSSTGLDTYLDSVQVVFEGTFVFAGGLNMIQLQTPIAYDGQHNLAFVVTDSTGVGTNEYFYFYTIGGHSTYYSNSSYSSGYYSMSGNRPSLYFSASCDMNPCPQPQLEVAHVTDSSVFLNFSRLYGTADFEFLRLRDSAVTRINNVTVPIAEMTNFEVAGLTYYSDYILRVRSHCESGDSSLWTTVNFTTNPGNFARYYVKPVACGTGDGTSWDNAMGDINEAVQIANATASLYGTHPEVWVAAGTYYGDTMGTSAFYILGGVNVYGGFVGTEISLDERSLPQAGLPAYQTILDGGNSRRVLYQNSSYNYDTIIWDGFIIQNGYLSDNGAGAYLQKGGVLRNSIVRNCISSYNYGGIYAYYGRVENCVVDNCRANTNGGGIYASYANIVNTKVSNCYAGNSGGGIYLNYGNNVENCLIVNDTAYNYSGIYASYNNNNIRNCDIVGNYSISANGYSGIYSNYGNNNVYNSIIWNNSSSGEISYQLSGGYGNVKYCAIQGGYDGEGNITLYAENSGTGDTASYPLFTNPATGDYSLQVTSPLLDAGNSQYSTLSTDLAGNPRVYNDMIDMGCYENNDPSICLRPLQPSLTLSGMAAMVEWTTPDGVTAVELEYKTTDTADWTSVTGLTDSRYMLTDIQREKDYEVRLRSVCGVGQYSHYTSSLTFSTRCNPLVCVGDSTVTNTVNYLPLYFYYGNSCSQQLFLASEVGTARTINGIKLQYSSSNVENRSIRIFLGHTSKTNFSDYANLSPYDMTLVVDSTITFTNENNWITIPFNASTFYYNGFDNLVVAMYDSTGTSPYSSRYFKRHTASETTTLYYQYGGSLSNTSWNSTSYRNNIVFMSDCNDNVSCNTPLLLVDGATAGSVTLTCQTNIATQLQYRLVNETTWTDATAQSETVLTGLLQNSQYQARLRAVCGEGDTSQWNTVSFTTLLRHLDTFYVKATATGTGDGSSWDNAATLANALSWAKANYATFGNPVSVWVAAGTYTGNFTMDDGVNVYGGFAGTETDLAQRPVCCIANATNLSILDGNNNGRVLTQNSNAYNGTVWDGFIIQNGYNNNDNGGAVYMQHGGTLRNAIVRNSFASNGSGGAIYASQSRIENVTVQNCRSQYGGGGIYSDGGKIINCTVTNCRSNVANWGNSGGGIYSTNDTIVGCVISNDTCYSYGALYAYSSYVANCLVYGNVSQYDCAVYSYYSTLVNNTIVCNHVTNSTSNCSGVYLYGGSMTNCVVWGNTSPNNASQMYTNGNNNVTYSAIQGGTAGTGNITLEADNFGDVVDFYYPQFASPEDGDYRLVAGSPLINAGTLAALPASITTDLAGNPRVYGDTIDIGCYENNGEVICTRPTGLQATVSSSAAVLSWNASSTVQSSELQYRMTGESDWNTIDQIEGTNYMLTNLSEDTSYEARVRSYCGSATGYGPWSSTVTFATRCVSDIFVGDSTGNTTSEAIPINYCWYYTYSQQIYTADEMGSASTIEGIQFNINPNGTVNRTDEVQIYMAHTNKSSFVSSSDAVDANAFSLVFDGTVNFGPSDAWTTVPFTTPFSYNGTDNVVVAILAHIPNYTYVYFNCDNHDNYMTLTATSDGSPFTLSSSMGYSYNNRATLRFLTACDDGSCPQPLITVTNVTDSSAKLMCQTNVGDAVELQYKRNAADNWISVTPTTEVTLTNLSQNTTYTARIRSLCGATDSSLWRTVGFTTLPARQTRFYVANTPSGRGDGTSWANACDSLQWAVASAKASMERYHTTGVEVWVAAGTYYGNFSMEPGINVYGGFAGTETALIDRGTQAPLLAANQSILDARRNGRVLNQPNDFTAATAATWDGFTIQHGYLNNYNNYGAGAYLNQYGTLSNCTIRDCYGYYYGGLYNNRGNVTNCIITGDTSVYNGVVRNYSGTLENCLIANNLSTQSYVFYNDYGTNIGLTIVGNLVNSNSAVFISSGFFRNSIIWGNRPIVLSADEFNQTSVTSNGYLYYCAVEGNVPNDDNSHNISLDTSNAGTLYSPMFVNPSPTAGTQALLLADPDYRLADGSICVNRGNNSYVTTTTDLGGNNRVQVDTVDIGCYESNYGASYLPYYNSVVYVKATASGEGDGTSWDNAMSDINRAQQVASMNNIHQVWVAAGTYYGGFFMQPGINVYGGFAGTETSLADRGTPAPLLAANQSILDGRDSVRVLTQNTSFDNNSAATWDGFVLQNGNVASDNGGGAYIQQNGTLTNSIVRSCYAQYCGGVYLNNGTLSNSIVTADSSQYDAAVYVNGGTMENCLVANNSTLYSNYSGVYSYGGTLRGNTIVRNLSYSTNSTSYGLYLYDYYYNSSNVYNNIVWGNRNANENVTMQQINSTSYGNILNNAVEGGVDKAGNFVLSSDNNSLAYSPMFVNPTATAGTQAPLLAASDWHLANGSLCVNRGNNGYAILAIDLDGNARVQNDTVDLGCFESDYSSIPLPLYNDSIVYVRPVAMGYGNGTSWDNAIGDINMAQQIASTNGIKNVWVAAGSYKGDQSGMNAFTMVPGVNVYGGFAGTEAPDYDLGQRNLTANVTLLDGDHLRRVLIQSGNFSQNTAVVWDGFTITGGYLLNASGAGVYMRNWSTLQNCVIIDNMVAADYNGGGVYIGDGTTYSRSVGGNSVTDYSTKLVNCKITGNSTQYSGGGIYIASSALVSNCLVTANTAGSRAGGIYISNNGYVINTTVSGNSCGNYYDGSGVYMNGGKMRNSIVWGNKKGLAQGDNLYTNNYYSLMVANCAIEGTDADTLMNLSAMNDGNDPAAFYVRFNDPTGGDYTLHQTSNCLDMGDSTDYWLIPGIDLDGNLRWNGDIDYGPYEGSYNNSCLPVVAVSATGVTSSQATIGWTPTGTETQWAVRYRLEESNNDTTFVVNNTPSVTLTNLLLNRSYMVYVRALCSDNSSSAWSIPCTFTTDCDPTQLDPLSPFTTMLPANGYVAYSSTIDLGWSSIPEATSYDLYVWREGDAIPATPTRSRLSIAGLSYQIPDYNNHHGDTYHWYVVAWNECISLNSDTLDFTVPHLPNLHVSGFTHSADVRSNSQITFEWTVVNDGLGATPPGATWNDYVWMSDGSQVGGGFLYGVDETLLATVPNLQALAPGESYTNSVTVTLPRDKEGARFFFVFADQYSANNIDYSEAGTATIPIPYEPDKYGPGNPYHYFSSQTESYPGNFIYSQIRENALSVVVGPEDADNFFYKAVTILPPPAPDLTVTNIVHPLNAQSGENVTVRFQVTNNGEAATTADYWSDAVYISAEETFSYNNATLIGTVMHSDGNLAVNQSYTDSVTGEIPIRFSGTYYVYVITDIDNNEYERLFEDNNIAQSNQTMNIIMSPVPDLAIDSIGMLPEVLSARGQYSLGYKVTNVGARAVTSSVWHDAVYLSATPTFSLATARRIGLAQRSIDLDMEQSYRAAITITIPDSINGIRYIFVKTDINDEVFEYIYEDNNIAAYYGTPASLPAAPAPVTIALPDLQPQWVEVPDSIDANKSFTVRWMVKNVGQGDLLSRNVADRIMLGNNSLFTSSHNNASIAAGDSMIFSAVIRLSCIPETTARLIIESDYGNYIVETDNGNNKDTSVSVTVVTPDLAPSALAIQPSALSPQPSALASGNHATISWSLTNNGTVAIDDTLTDKFYFATGTDLSGATLIAAYKRHLSLLPGESINETTQVTLPNGVSGNLRLHQATNASGAICEGANSADNHIYTDVLEVELAPYPDLTITSLATASNYNLGETFLLDYTVHNGGTGAIENTDVTTKFYITPNTTLNTNYATLLGSDVQRMNIAVDGSHEYTATLRIPTNLNNGYYYIFAVVDANNDVYEYTGEGNNITRSGHIILNVYQLDIAATALNGPTDVEWGGSYTYTLTVENLSQLPSLAYSWVDKLYISSDNTFNTSDQQVGQVYHHQHLAAGGSYTVTYNVTIPMGTDPNGYLIAVADADLANPDMNINNNMMTMPLNVASVPTADLAVGNVEVIDHPVLSGQAARVAYTVTNVSEVAISDATWTDKVFLSANSSYESSDVEVGSTIKRNMSLPAGASYTDTATFRVPLPQNGTMFLIVRANSGNNFYETNTANNIVATSTSVLLPQPGDLVVDNIVSDDSVVSGRYLHMQWKVKNIGENSLSGNGLRSLVYISTNNTFDAGDRLLGNVATDNVMLAPGGELQQQLVSRISGLPEGNYYLIVKTDVANAFNESNDTNNTSPSLFPVNVSVRNLPFNTPLADTIKNNLANDYKLIVGNQTGETVRIHVDAADTTSGAVNMIYVSHNNIGSDLNYTYSTIGQFSHSPELYIPSTEMGYYGVNVIGSTPTDSIQAINIEADILPFELRAVNPAEGGNTGTVTVELTGSRFRPDMQVWMDKDSAHRITPDTLMYDSYYRAFATFDLKGADTGWYSVSVLNYCEGEAVLNHAFNIVPGTPENLGTNLIMPASPRPNRTVMLILEFGNIGTTDIHAPVVELESIGGSYISLTNDGLAEHKTKIQIPLVIDGEPQGTIRPGATGSVLIYCYTQGTMVFSVKRVR